MPSEIEGIHNLVPAESHLLILIDINCLMEENALYLFFILTYLKCLLENRWEGILSMLSIVADIYHIMCLQKVSNI